MEVSRLGVELELQLLAYTTTTATQDLQPTEEGQGSNLHPHGLVGFISAGPQQELPLIC